MDTNLTKALQLFGKSRGQMTDATAETLVQLYEAMSEGLANKLDEVPGFSKLTYAESGSAITGLTAYDLEGPAKLFYPVLTPLRNITPRTSGKGGIQANWRAITGVNTSLLNAGVSEGNRGGVVAVTTANYTAAYRGIGFESNASFEAQYAGETFDDVRMRAQQAGLHSLMIAEERMILQGNGTLALGTTVAPTLSAGVGTLGTLSNSTVSVICVGLTADGYYRNTVAGGIQQQYVRQNADGSTDTINGGVAIKSSGGTPITLSGGTSTQWISATTTAQRGAAAYAWYWGTAGAELLGAITTVPALSILATATGTQTAASLASTDYSVDNLAFSGLIYLAQTSGSGSYWTDLGGATLAGDGVGGITQIDAVLKSQWDTYRLNPDTLWVSSQQAKDIRSKVMAGASSGTLRFNIDQRQGMVAGGLAVSSYLNEYGLNGATEIQIKQHPYLTPGTMVFTQSTLPYPMNDTPNVFQMRCRQDYYSIEWPWRSRKYEYGVYCDEVAQLYFPPAIAVLTGIGAG